MSEPGRISWIDLTVPDAEGIRDFYQYVAGWEPSPVAMGVYEDYCMTPPGAEVPVAAICHARGYNEDLPPAWLIYITVGDLDEAIRRCQERGGKVRVLIRDTGGHGATVLLRTPREW